MSHDRMGVDYRSVEFQNAIQTLRQTQRKRVEKLFTDDLFLFDVACGEVETVFSVAGSTGNPYFITLQGGTLACDCPDARTHCVRGGLVCKHAAFVLICVLGITTLDYFRGNVLRREELAFAHRRLQTMRHRVSLRLGVQSSGGEQRIDDQENRRSPSPRRTRGDSRPATEGRAAAGHKAARLVFSHVTQESDDDCPICYDRMADPAVKCPDCSHVMHTRCVERWLRAAPVATCVYCRSTAWKAFTPRK